MGAGDWRPEDWPPEHRPLLDLIHHHEAHLQEFTTDFLDALNSHYERLRQAVIASAADVDIAETAVNAPTVRVRPQTSNPIKVTQVNVYAGPEDSARSSTIPRSA